jgi:hypothetical protein
MAESKFNVEGATNGLVLALFLASALFLGVMLLYVLGDIRTRTAPADPSGAASSTGAASLPSAPLHAVHAPAQRSV